MTSKGSYRPLGVPAVILLPAAFAFGVILGANGALAGGPGPTDEGVNPTSYRGNFVADNDQQVCFELELQGVIESPLPLPRFRASP